MNIVKKVTIKNFRSINRQEFEPCHLTLLVGQNDSGKSNFLRALNLFFNNQTDPGRGLVFPTDFSTHAVVARGKAKQIEVWLDIEPPASFSDRPLVRWRRAWREGDSNFAWQDIRRIGDGKELSGRSKIFPWLNRIKYKYVPAIKSADYFALLLRDVHDVLAETVDKELRTASFDFIGAIRAHTDKISALTSQTLGMESKLQLPTDLRALFEVLDFETSYEGGTKSLQQRGDGIKVRHVSAILKFLSDQEKKLAGPGRARPSTIWGYEEPENNLELSRAFAHAEELRDFSSDIQILVSTHSPAFYSLLLKDQSISGYDVTPSSGGTVLRKIQLIDINNLDTKLGLMTLVTPYIADKAKELDEIRQEFERLESELVAQKQKLVILTAGKTDVQYLKTAFDVLSPDISKKVTISAVGKEESGGTTGGGDSHLLKFTSELCLKPDLHTGKILVVLDCDVKKCPVSPSEKIHYRILPYDGKNEKFKKGIENLLPSSLALSSYYSEKKKTDDYGAVSTISTLNKVSLCTAVCNKEEELPVAWEERFLGFQPVVDWAREILGKS